MQIIFFIKNMNVHVYDMENVIRLAAQLHVDVDNNTNLGITGQSLTVLERMLFRTYCDNLNEPFLNVPFFLRKTLIKITVF